MKAAILSLLLVFSAACRGDGISRNDLGRCRYLYTHLRVDMNQMYRIIDVRRFDPALEPVFGIYPAAVELEVECLIKEPSICKRPGDRHRIVGEAHFQKRQSGWTCDGIKGNPQFLRSAAGESGSSSSDAASDRRGTNGDGNPPNQEPGGTKLRSTEGRTSTTLTFLNESGRVIAIYWLDYSGNEVFYRQLAPGESYAQPTFVTHPWRAREVGGGEELSTVVAQGEATVVVKSRSPKTR